jgi:hypothetical protein
MAKLKPSSDCCLEPNHLNYKFPKNNKIISITTELSKRTKVVNSSKIPIISTAMLYLSITTSRPQNVSFHGILLIEPESTWRILLSTSVGAPIRSPSIIQSYITFLNYFLLSSTRQTPLKGNCLLQACLSIKG